MNQYLLRGLMVIKRLNSLVANVEGVILARMNYWTLIKKWIEVIFAPTLKNIGTNASRIITDNVLPLCVVAD